MNTRNRGSRRPVSLSPTGTTATRAIIYTRVSTDEQAAHGYSLRAQEEKLRLYCTSKKYDVLEHFQDDASAKTFNRPAFRQLLEYIEQNRRTVDKLVFVKWDRFSRNAPAAYDMMRQLTALGVEVESVEQSLDLTVPEHKIMLALYLTTPEVENDRRSLNTRAGMRRAMKEGRWLGPPPKGYRASRDGINKPLLVLNDTAPLVREAFREVAKGVHTQEEVRRELRRKGLVCSKNQFSLMLRNPVYVGKIVVPAWKDEELTIVEAVHEPLIDVETFARVQDVLAGRAHHRIGTATRRHEELPLRGFLQCPRCGRNLSGGPSKGNGGVYYYYSCQKGCKERHKAETVNADFITYLQSIRVAPEVAQLYTTVLEDIFTEKEGDRAAELRRIGTELEEIERKLLRADDRFVEGTIEADSYYRLKTSYRSRRDELTQRKAQVEGTDSNFLQYVRYGVSLLTNVAGYYRDAPLEIKQKLIGSILSGKLVYENGTYRTTEPSIVLDLLCRKSGSSEGVNEKTDGDSTPSVLYGGRCRTTKGDAPSCRTLPRHPTKLDSMRLAGSRIAKRDSAKFI